ncbi:MAG: molybdenum cofactor guanylyltransferase [Pyrinomonadaceae bacterium]
MLEIEGFILVGGASSRMGEDKARLTLGGQTFVERIAHALSSITVRVNTVGAKTEDNFCGLPNVPDVYERWGALGGLHGALTACKAEWAAVVACDLPFVTGEFFTRLAQERDDFDAIVPVQMDGRVQPLCALYRSEVCRERAHELITNGERRPRALLQSVRTRYLAPHEWSNLNNATLFFQNINTREEYRKAVMSNE